jgi:hypothetical protein
MAFVHGRKTVVTIDGDSLTAFANSSSMELTVDAHDTTTYGKEAHDFAGGLQNGTATISGVYDSTAMTGPRAILLPMIKARGQVDLVHQPEGVGSGLPQDTVAVLVTKYNQTHPVADMVTWSVDLQFCEPVDSTPQAA